MNYKRVRRDNRGRYAKRDKHDRAFQKGLIGIGMIVMLVTLIISPAEGELSYEKEIETPIYIDYEYIAQWGRTYHINPIMLYDLVMCETAGTLSPTIQSNHTQDYGREESYGLAQIHLPDNPDISYEQATDPDYAMWFMVTEIKKGNGDWRWKHCWKSVNS